MKCAWLAAVWMAVIVSVTFAETKAKPLPKGVTMRIRQQMALGDLSTSTDYHASFLPPDGFRVDGTMRIDAMEMNMKMNIVGDAKQVRQISETPFGPQAYVIDLARVRKAIPEFSPASTYDPSAYKKMVETIADKKSLGSLTLDGIQTEGYEFALPGGRLSLPTNVPMGLPEPVAIRVWLCPKDGIARKTEMIDAQGKVFVATTYTDVKTGVSIPTQTFDLKFPDAVKPTDITSLILGRVAALRAPAEEKKDSSQPNQAPEGTDNAKEGALK